VYAFVESGAFAEYASVEEGILGRKPENLSFEQAAAVPLAALTALQGLRRGGIASGQRVLIVGASGGVGTFAVQIAKDLGADVTGVCSTGNVELVRSLGADRVIDYTREDFASGDERYDLILQLGGTRSPGDCRRALAAGGTLLDSSGDASSRWFGPLGRMATALALSPFVSQRLSVFEAKADADDLRLLTELIEAGTIEPVIERIYPLAETPDAIRHVETGHTRGKIVITM
jgi:NADPH:quinone reductase-like Zn-dependent oxidoreductase